MEHIRLRFLEFELIAAAYELRCDDEPVRLERIPMELLTLLIEQRGQLVTREMIVEWLWGTKVFLETEHSINTAINKLRAILHDNPKQPRCIQTVVGKGYRFIAEVTVIQPNPMKAKNDADTSAVAAPRVLTSPSIETPAADREPDSIPEKTLPPEPIPAVNRMTGSKIILAASLVVLFITTLAYLNYRRNTKAAPRPPRFESVAVLPFLDLSPQADKEYLVDGATDQLITLLAQNTSLRVISRTSVMQFKGARRPLPEIAEALKVDAVVEGSILRSDKGVRITVQLLNAKRDQHLWAQSYQEKESDSLDEQDKVTADMATHILQVLTNQTAPVQAPTQKHIANAKARDLYLRGGYFWRQRTLESLNKAIDYYNQAIQADPDFAAAYAALGEADVVLSSYGGPGPAKPLLQAREAAEKALKLDSHLGEAHTVLAAVKVDLDWDWSGAEQEYRRAVELNPNDSTAHHWYALHLGRLHRFPEAEVEMRQALALDPVSVIIQTDAAEIAYEARQPLEAERRVRRALDLDRNFAEAYLVLGKINEEEARPQDALLQFQRSSELFGAVPNIEALRGYALALLGKRKEAQELAVSLEAQSHRRYVSGVDIALIYCGLGDQDKSMTWLEHGLQEHDKGMDTLAAEPLFDKCSNIPSDHRFDKLLQRLNLTESLN